MNSRPSSSAETESRNIAQNMPDPNQTKPDHSVPTSDEALTEDRGAALPRGSTVYSKSSLRIYDFLVHFFSNRFIWRCPARHIIDHYSANLTSNHLEIGIGSGKLFKKSAADAEFDRLVIADVNPECLEFATSSLQEWNPETWKVNLINPAEEFERVGQFTSIGLNYVLHCLPATMSEKLAICDRLIDKCLCDGGVLFGSTLFPNQNSRWLSKRLMGFYNRKGVFTNEADSSESFKEWCADRGRDYSFFAIGCVGFFSIRKN